MRAAIFATILGTTFVWCAPAWAGLKAHWSFNNTTADTTGNVSPTGTLEDGATFSVMSAPGVGGSGSLDVTGATSHFLVPNQPAVEVGAGDFTLAAWIRPDGGGSGPGRIFDIRGRGDLATNAGFQYIVDQSAGNWHIDNTFLADGTGTYISYDTRAMFGSTASGTTYSNDWHHVALAYEAGVGATFYVDGMVDGTSLGVLGDLDDGNPATMGASILNNGVLDSGPMQTFSGLIDELFLFDEVLTEDQINNLITINAANPPEVPEPGTWVLFGTAMLAMGLYQWRRRRVISPA